MHTSPLNARAISKSGMEALQRGDARGARAAFEQVLAARLADACLCLALAYACRSMQDGHAALNAIDNALAMEPRNLRALIFKADHLHEAGGRRVASSRGNRSKANRDHWATRWTTKHGTTENRRGDPAI